MFLKNISQNIINDNTLTKNNTIENTIQNTTPDVITTTLLSRSKVPIEMKIAVWVKNFGHHYLGKCYYCVSTIIIPISIYDEVLGIKTSIKLQDLKKPRLYYGTHFDNIISDIYSSTVRVENILPICKKCNQEKGIKTNYKITPEIINKREIDKQTVYMDIDVKYGNCQGIVYDRKYKKSRMCKNDAQLDCKCSAHFDQQFN
jgi:hypothetical protein